MTNLKKRCTTLILALLMFATVSLGVLLSVNKTVVNASEVVINPIAKYEFKDKDNLGKDSMGNYDMEYRRKWVQDGTGEILNTYVSVDEVNGGVTFDKSFCLAQDAESNMFADVTAFTLCFEIITDKQTTEWAQYIGVGNSSDVFAFIGRNNTLPGQLRLHTYNMLEWNGGTSNIYNAPKIPFATGESVQPTAYQKIVVSVQPGGNMLVYLNGTLVTLKNPNASNQLWNTSIDEDWATATGKSFFAIGGRYNGAVDRMTKGSIRNVQFYDFAMDAACVSAYDTNGYITTSDVSNLNTITGAEVDFDANATSEELNSAMSTDEMLAKVNDANATLSLSNGSTVQTPITWNSVEQVEDKYFVNGTFSTSKLGYANTIGNTISYELPVIEASLTAEIKGVSVSTMGDFGLNFYVTMPNGTQSATAKMAMDGYEEIEVNGVYVEKEDAYMFAYPVAAKDFDKDVTLTLTKINGEEIDYLVNATYSVKAYAEKVNDMEVDGAITQELKDLTANLNTYCEQAGVYFAEDNLDVEKVTENVVSSSDLVEFKSTLSGEDDNVVMVGASLVLESKTRIHVYFKSETDVVCKVNNETVQATAVEGQDGLYVVAIEVLAQNLGDMYQIEIGGYSVSYGAYSYIEACIDNVEAPLYNVLQALYDYGTAADVYFE